MADNLSNIPTSTSQSDIGLPELQHTESGAGRTIYISQTPTLAGLSEELRQWIVRPLSYKDAWSLKRTSKWLSKVILIPTVKIFKASPTTQGYILLKHEGIINEQVELCYICRRLRPLGHFSREMRKQIAGRHSRKSGVKEKALQAYQPEKQFCLRCGFENGKYRLGEKILTGFGATHCSFQAALACPYCRRVAEFWSTCKICQACPGCIGTRQPGGEKRETRRYLASETPLKRCEFGEHLRYQEYIQIQTAKAITGGGERTGRRCSPTDAQVQSMGRAIEKATLGVHRALQ